MDYVIKDSYRLQLSDEAKGQKDSIQGQLSVIKDSSGLPALEVVLDATHGGYVNENYSQYSKDGQREGAKSWTAPYPKPVLVEHDDEKSAIGRVVEAQYVDIPVDQNSLAAGGDHGRPQCKITLRAIITEMDAIQKVLDGRFMTVSISGRPKTTPTCSICHNPVEGFMGCEDGHVRGKKYEGKLCYYEIGEMRYSEVSFVNKPADQSEAHVAAVTSFKAIENPGLSSAARQAMEEALHTLKNSQAATAGKVTDSTEVKPVEPTEQQQEEPCPECEDNFWTEAEKVEIAPIAAEYDKYIEGPDMGDKPLTTEQRKNMAASKFCGPNRSFPIPDCKHVAVGKTYLKRAKLSSSTKAKVLACINRKAKALKCSTGDSGSEDVTQITIELLEEARQQLTSEVTNLVAQKAEIDNLLKATNEKITATLAQLEAAQADLKKLQETSAAEIKKVQETAETQHKQDLQQTQELTQKLRDSMVKSILLNTIILGKEGILNVLSGTKAEDRVKSYKEKAEAFKNSSMDDLTKKDTELFDELTKITLVKVDIGTPEGVIGDKYLAQAKQQASRAQRLKDWFDSK